MLIQTTRGFDKQHSRLSPKIKWHFQQRLSLFITDPFDPALRNHLLRGKYKGYRSINVTGDVRALYIVKGSSVIIFSVIGTHSQLY